MATFFNRISLKPGANPRLRAFALLPLLFLLSLTAPVAASGFSTDDEKNTMEIFRRSSPAVVYVTNQTTVRDRYSLNVHTIPKGTGTGVIWDRQGYIITNYHVIEGATKIIITLQDQSSWSATVKGIAPSKDLAILKIEAPTERLTPLPLGDSNELTVGRKVVAIGNPFGLDTTLTVGVVSALGREIKSGNQRTIHNVIQTDAAINPGNSGGPLINSSGELVGINTAIYSPSGASVGIGFAIPVNTVKQIVPQLIAHGKLQRPSLGIEIGPSQWAQRYGIKGVPIFKVMRNSPAAKAGLTGVQRSINGSAILGDIIIGLGSQVIEDQDDLLGTLESFKAGDQLQIELVRNGKIEKRLITLAPTTK